jgi:Flp pilus assembly protein TadD
MRRSAPTERSSRPDELTERARRHRARGETRRALVALREACLLDETSAPRWTLLGAVLRDLGKPDDAARAWKQALWLREQLDDEPRAAVMRRLIVGLTLPVVRASRHGRHRGYRGARAY